MWSQGSGKQGQGHLKVIRAFINGEASNLVHVITFEGHTSSRASQGHRGIDYWIGLKLSTCDHIWEPNKFKVISRSSGHLLLDWPQTNYMWSQFRAKYVQGHLKVISYWFNLKLSRYDQNRRPNMFKVIGALINSPIYQSYLPIIMGLPSPKSACILHVQQKRALVP